MQTVTFDADLYKLVPLEPKGEMYEIDNFSGKYMTALYKSMIAASAPIKTEEK